MTDDITTETSELADVAIDPLPAFTGQVSEAIEHAVAAQDPIEVGDHHLLVRVPTGYSTQLIDVRDSEDIPRRVTATQRLVGVDSLARYVDQHRLADTRAYIVDCYGTGTKMLRTDTNAMTVIIDDHHAGNLPDTQSHRAVLVLRPTSAARRWGTAIEASHLAQDQFLDLVVDGIGEIQLAENVRLSAGTGDKVEFPERITIAFAPFAGIPASVTLELQVRPTVHANHVAFSLHAATLEDQIANVLGEIAADFNERTGLNPLWTV